MNRAYRLIWSDINRTWVAVSEIVKARGKRSGGTVLINNISGTGCFLLKTLASSLLMAGMAHAAPPVNALPTGGTVSAGQATLQQTGNTLNINQSTAKAALNWNTFNVGRDATVNFNQPSASSVTLNRVTGGNPSQIFGRINANGQVFLSNGSGIYFAPSASVNVGAFTATTHSITDNDFMAGRYLFNRNGASGSVINDGNLSTNDINGYIALLAPEVRNNGVIIAQLGTVALAAGEAFELQFDGNNLLNNIRVTASTIQALVENGNAVHAPDGLIILSAQAVNSLQGGGIINNSGTLEASGFTNNGGVVRLSASDSISHTGKINVDAASNSTGNGGTATLIASLDNPNSITQMNGSISAKGGDLGGHGGFVETSGANVQIGDNARIGTAAKMGSSGTWLIDPTDFKIAASGGDVTGTALGALLANSSITIETATSPTASFTNLIGSAGSNGDIIVNDPVSWSANTALTLNAYRNININQSITAAGASGSLALFYGQGAAASNNTASYSVNASVNLQSGQNFSTKLGSDGTVKNYTVITDLGVQGSTTTTHLQGINGGLTGNYVLGSNIDASATASWNSNAGFTPIKSELTVNSCSIMGCWNQIQVTPFTGTFDGLGHTISNLTINLPSQSNVALFGQTSSVALIQNIGLVDGSVSGSGSVGGLVGSNGGNVSNSYATGNVSGSTVGMGIGGLVGENSGTVSNSYATGNVSGGSMQTGGLVGRNSGPISNSYATGSVSGGSMTGGLVGYSASTVSNSYATGSVSGTSYVGGLVGNNLYIVSNSYWNTTTSGQSTSAGGTGLTTVQMQTAANFGGFNFTSTPGATGNNWVMVDADGSLNNAGGTLGSTRPMLASEYSTTINNAHQLQLVAMAPAASYTLGANINAAATGLIGGVMTDVWGSAGFVPVGNSSTNFTGTFDGLGHTISNLATDNSAAGIDRAVGLFGVTSSTSFIRNLGLINPTVRGFDHWVGGLVGDNSGLVSHTFVEGATGSITAGSTMGGLVGINWGTIEDSYAAIKVTGSNRVGGLVGNNKSIIMRSYSNSPVYADTGQDLIGGLVGQNEGGTISNSYATGNVASWNSSVGGLVGGNGGTVTNSYATGSVSGAANLGGLIGTNGGAVTNSFWNTQTSGQATSSGGTGMTSVDMQTQVNFASATSANGNVNPAWDLTTPLWKMESGKNNGYPYLSWQTFTPVYLRLVAGSSIYGNTPSLSYALYDASSGGNVVSNASSTGSVTWSTPLSATSAATTYGETYVSGITLGNANFTLSAGGSINWTINPSPLNLTVSKSYNGSANFDAGFVLAGMMNSDSAPTVSGNASVTSANAATYSSFSSSTLSLDNANYILTGGTVAATISKASATVTGNSSNVTYTGVAQTATGFTATGLVNNEAAAVLTNVSATGTGTNAGTYANTPSGSDGNYTLTFVGGNLVIGKAHLTVTADNQSRYYGAANPPFTETITGYVNSETLSTSGIIGTATGSSTATTATGAGTTTIVARAPGLSADNYDVTNLVDGILTINTKIDPPPSSSTGVSSLLPGLNTVSSSLINFILKLFLESGADLSELKLAGFSISELKLAGFSISDIKSAGFSVSDLKSAGYSLTAILSAGDSEIVPLVVGDSEIVPLVVAPIIKIQKLIIPKK